MLSLVGGAAAFSSPVTIAAGSHFTRTAVPSMGQKMTRKQRKAAVNVDTSAMEGRVVPTKTAPAEAKPLPTTSTAIEMAAIPAPASKLPPLAGTTPVFTRLQWNPNGLDVSLLPGPLKAQFVPAYLKTAPSYLDGSMPGDIGFDPWGLVALANPSQATDAFARTAKARDARMLAMAPKQQAANLAWMRESELKHARLAMLAAAGWPMAELYSGDFLHGSGGTNGRAPSLFNGHLLEYLPFLIIIFGPIFYFELTARGKSDADRLGFGGAYAFGDGEYFDPMGLAGTQQPEGAFPFDSFMASKTPIDALPNAKDMDKMKLAEIKNGRVAMMGITGMAVQECLYGNPVVDQTPFFFGR